MNHEPGIYTMPAAEYHALPYLSSSLARRLIGYSPLHAWWDSPGLNPAYEPDEDEKFDLGTAAHAYILQGETGFSVIEAEDWRTKVAQLARVEARLAGKTPLLASQWARVQTMSDALRAQLAKHEDPPIPLLNGAAERVLIWREGDVMCRAMLDWLHADRRTIDDLKTVGETANPDVWGRTLFGAGLDVQAAFYLRGVKAVFGIDARFRFVVVENTPPYAASVIGLTPAALDLGARKVKRAITIWRDCLTANTWPGYPARTCYVDPPAWASAQWLEQELRGQTAPPIDDGRPLADQLLGAER